MNVCALNPARHVVVVVLVLFRNKGLFKCEHSTWLPFDRILDDRRLYGHLSPAAASVIGNAIFVNYPLMPLFSSISSVHNDRPHKSAIAIELQQYVYNWKIIWFRKYKGQNICMKIIFVYWPRASFVFVFVPNRHLVFQ